MPHQKQVELGLMSSAVLSILGVAMLVGLTVGEKIGKLWSPKR